MILAVLPPGAFIVVGFLIAAKNSIDNYLKEKAAANQPAKELNTGGKRVRTTGPIA